MRGAESNSFELDTILGLVCDPWGTPDNFNIYISASEIYPNRGAFPEDALYQPGAILRLNSAEKFDKLHYVIVNLATSNYDHALNGLEFTMDGRLLITAGSPTNAGLPNFKLGGLEGGPLTGAILQANVHDPDFDGVMQYGFIDDARVDPAADSMDMRQQGWVQVVSGDVGVYSAGFRNPYDVTICPIDLTIFATDNSANKGRAGGLRVLRELTWLCVCCTCLMRLLDACVCCIGMLHLFVASMCCMFLSHLFVTFVGVYCTKFLSVLVVSVCCTCFCCMCTL